jgi:NADH dehydrogenase FAD-containing subunit
MEKVLPKSVRREQTYVKLVKPDQNTVVCENGEEFTYDELIVGTGLRLQF